MKAIGFLHARPSDHPEALVDIQLPRPEPKGRDLLIKVQAVSVNPVDTKVRATATPEAGQHKVLGWDAVGEVIATGTQAKLFNVGDQVWYAGDITRSGCNAEYHLVDERIVAIKPKSLSNAQAAALPLTAITAWELLFDRLGFSPKLAANPGSARQREPAKETSLGGSQPQPSILIVGAAGGVGSILVQLAATLTDATVVGTASRAASQAWVQELGAHHVIDHHRPFRPQLEALGVSNLSHVISLTHSDQHFDQLVDALAPQGKLALIDDPAQAMDIKKLKLKSLSLHWELMFTRAMFGTWDMIKQHELLTQVSRLIDNNTLRTTLGKHFGTINAANLRKAHGFIESQKSVGKVVLEGF